MRIEHMAINVGDPVAVADWYVKHLGFRVKRRSDGPRFMHFLADATDTTMIEVYHNDAAPVPDYRAQHPLVLHLALASKDVEADRLRLLEAGATAVGEVEQVDGDELAMLRDPWGLAVQLVRRRHPMI